MLGLIILRELHMRKCHRCFIFIFLLASLAACGAVDDPSLFPEYREPAQLAEVELPQTQQNSDRNLYFGDLHIHTGLSTDAYVMGVRSRPDDAYRFAKGHTLQHAAGYPIQIARPLDFAAVTDHSEYLGQAMAERVDMPTSRKSLRQILLDGNPLSITWAWLKTTLTIRSNGFGAGMDQLNVATNRSAWQETIDAAERHYQPQRFTTFVGYEWSASVGDIATHIHRNVIYRGSDVSDLPFSSIDSSRPEDLWEFLKKEEAKGNVAIAIPHNANVSRGNMYPTQDSNGNKLNKNYADLRTHFEPVSEILQIKGASETHPLLSPLDEFAEYGVAQMQPGEKTSLQTVTGSYLRDALRKGLVFSRQEGFNPYRIGVIGASDSHNASSPADENDYTGKLPMMDGSAGLRTGKALLLPDGVNPVTSWSSGGLAGVWALENTREALFDALRRRETYATSGPRIKLRMFGGWHFKRSLLDDPSWVTSAYEMGVPMGSLLPPHTGPTPPTFVVAALKDELGANLDRIQIVKGWVDENGSSHEKIFDIAAASRKADTGSIGKLPPIGSTVDLASASYKNTIGASSLTGFWRDPEFDPTQNAFYYARVLEIPTPRWSTYDAVRLGIPPMQPAVIQERAISSSIWYSPAN